MMDYWIKRLQLIIAIGSVMGMVGIGWGAYAVLTPRSEHNLLAMRVDYKIQVDMLQNLREEILYFQKKYDCVGNDSKCFQVMPQLEQCKYKQLLEQLHDQEEVVKELRKQVKGIE